MPASPAPALRWLRGNRLVKCGDGVCLESFSGVPAYPYRPAPCIRQEAFADYLPLDRTARCCSPRSATPWWRFDADKCREVPVGRGGRKSRPITSHRCKITRQTLATTIAQGS